MSTGKAVEHHHLFQLRLLAGRFILTSTRVSFAISDDTLGKPRAQFVRATPSTSPSRPPPPLGDHLVAGADLHLGAKEVHGVLLEAEYFEPVLVAAAAAATASGRWSRLGPYLDLAGAGYLGRRRLVELHRVQVLVLGLKEGARPATAGVPHRRAPAGFRVPGWTTYSLWHQRQMRYRWKAGQKVC
ncbi:hypothetical protein BHE74_00025778 [Ensete ventricosum]|nr:hypothetical protein BHE74_00025778 [Ensete ventricosum]